MGEASGEVVFHGDWQATAGSAIWYVIALGVVGALTATLVSIALPIGPWWMWLLANVPFVLLGRWEMGRSAVEIELVEAESGLRLRVRGRGGNLDEPVDRYEPGATGERVPIRRGGGVMTSVNIVAIVGRGRRIGFRQMGGADPRGWPERKPRLDDGADTFSVLNIFGIEKALRRQA